MNLRNLWRRIETMPYPRRPGRILLQGVMLSFLVGLAIAPYLPETWATDSVPIRIGAPFRLAGLAAFIEFIGIGSLLQKRSWRKPAFIVFACLFLFFGAFLWWFTHTMFQDLDKLKIDALEHHLHVGFWVLIPVLVATIAYATIGWLRWSMSLPRHVFNSDLGCWEWRPRQPLD